MKSSVYFSLRAHLNSKCSIATCGGVYHLAQGKSRVLRESRGHFQSSNLLTPGFRAFLPGTAREGLTLQNCMSSRAPLDLEQIPGAALIQKKIFPVRRKLGLSFPQNKERQTPYHHQGALWATSCLGPWARHLSYSHAR